MPIQRNSPLGEGKLFPWATQFLIVGSPHQTSQQGYAILIVLAIASASILLPLPLGIRFPVSTAN